MPAELCRRCADDDEADRTQIDLDEVGHAVGSAALALIEAEPTQQRQPIRRLRAEAGAEPLDGLVGGRRLEQGRRRGWNGAAGARVGMLERAGLAYQDHALARRCGSQPGPECHRRQAED